MNTNDYESVKKQLLNALNEKETENGDKAFNSTLNKYFDIIGQTAYYRENLVELLSFNIDTGEFDKWFSMLVRDGRLGSGERAIGRILLSQTSVTPEEVYNCGRADDLLFIGIEAGRVEFLDYFIKKLLDGDLNCKKWFPREHSSKKEWYKVIMKRINKKFIDINNKQIRKLIKSDTVESVLSRNEIVKDYSKVPSLAMLKYFNTFIRKDGENFGEYLEEVKNGEKKMNTSVTTPYDLFKVKIEDTEKDIIFNSFKNKKFNILPILDNSASMYDNKDSSGKAKAIAHYVAKNSTYLYNIIMFFSDRPKLVELGYTYRGDMKILNSCNDVANTDFSKVMKALEKIQDYPDYFLVLSDMEFDAGSNQTKDDAMKIIKEKSEKTRIIWWNFNSRQVTFPEIDKYGNIFLSGYSPQLLSLLDVNFDLENVMNGMVEEYKKQYNNKYNI